MRNISDESVPDTLSLSKRKMEVLSLLAEGLVKKEIADQLNIAYGTVDSYIKEVYEELHVHNAPSAVNKAHRLGLFEKHKKH
jgi:DNA-binding NarL/FixJ family response regulator